MATKYKVTTRNSTRKYSSVVGWIAKNYKRKSVKILDFGSGTGRNSKSLRRRKYVKVREYDPHVKGKTRKPAGSYDLVICNYVLNILPANLRSKVVKELDQLNWKTLIIEVRPKIEDIDRNWKKHSDGFISPANTFQKVISDSSLKRLRIRATTKEILWKGCIKLTR